MTEHGGPHGIKKTSKFKPWVSKVEFFEICVDDIFIFFLVQQKGVPQNTKIWFGAASGPPKVRFWMPFNVQPGPLYLQILARLYIH